MLRQRLTGKPPTVVGSCPLPHLRDSPPSLLPRWKKRSAVENSRKSAASWSLDMESWCTRATSTATPAPCAIPVPPPRVLLTAGRHCDRRKEAQWCRCTRARVPPGARSQDAESRSAQEQDHH